MSVPALFGGYHDGWGVEQDDHKDGLDSENLLLASVVVVRLSRGRALKQNVGRRLVSRVFLNLEGMKKFGTKGIEVVNWRGRVQIRRTGL